MKNPIVIRYESGQMTFASPDCLLEIDNQKLKKLVFTPLFDLPFNDNTYDENKNTIEKIKEWLENAPKCFDKPLEYCRDEFFPTIQKKYRYFSASVQEKIKSKISRVTKLFNEFCIKFGLEGLENKGENEMKKENGFKKGSYKIAARLECGKHGLKEVSGYVSGDIGVEKKQSGSYTYWTATYIPSGLLIGADFATRQKAFEESKVMLEKTDKSVLQKGIEQFQNLLKDFEIEKANPAENTDNPEPETTAEIVKKIAEKAKEVFCKNCGFKLSSGMFSAYMTSDRTKYSCPECRTKQPTIRRDLPENTADEKKAQTTTADFESAEIVEEPQPEPQPTMPMFDGVARRLRRDRPA